MIYFIADGEYVKVGYTDESVSSRLSSLQTGNPRELKILGVIEGDYVVENTLHNRFIPWHVRGEWFALTDDLHANIDKLLSDTKHIETIQRIEKQVFSRLHHRIVVCVVCGGEFSGRDNSLYCGESCKLYARLNRNHNQTNILLYHKPITILRTLDRFDHDLPLVIREWQIWSKDSDFIARKCADGFSISRHVQMMASVLDALGWEQGGKP